jgi:hypothetical protein
MLTYKAMYQFLDQGVHAEVLDFPGTITFGENLAGLESIRSFPQSYWSGSGRSSVNRGSALT